jgi:hypothetical protein
VSDVTPGDQEDASAAEAERVLYGGPRATFVERRTQLAATAKRAGAGDEAKRIAKLPKPTVAAHAVNLLAHADDDRLTRVLELGANIRAAFGAGDDAVMRELLQQRTAVLAAAAKGAAAVSEERISGAARDQILQTLRAAMADEDAAAAVACGTLADALDEPGFATLGVAPPPRATKRTKAPARPDAARPDVGEEPTDQVAERAVEEARAAARADAAAAAERLAAVTGRRAELARRLADLQAELDALHTQLQAAIEAEESARADRDRADAALAELER